MSNAKLSPLMGFPGFKMEYIVIDVLHCCDLGITQDAIGNVLADWLQGVRQRDGCNKAEALALLNDRLKHYRKVFQPPTAINRIMAEMVQSKNKMPKLRAKGAETRHLVRFAVELCLELLDVGDLPRSQVRYRCLSALFEFYNTMSTCPFDPVQAKRCAQEHITCYVHLGWVLKPKHHIFLHLGEDQALEVGNPRDFWCYMDEDFVGRLGKVSGPRGGSRTATGRVMNLMRRYRAWCGKQQASRDAGA